jgi:hypothetical protein
MSTQTRQKRSEIQVAMNPIFSQRETVKGGLAAELDFTSRLPVTLVVT